MRRQSLTLFLLAIGLALASYLFFGLFLRGDVPSYAVEIAAALMGSLITVIITMLLLARQSESELLRERNVRLLDAKIKVYDGLIDAVKVIVRTGQVGPEQQLEIQMLNQRLSFYASTEVLRAFNAFAQTFARVAEDQKVTQFEQQGLLDVLGELAVRIRYDLASEEDRRGEKGLYESGAMGDLVKANVTTLRAKTTEDQFLEKCDEHDRAYYKALFEFLTRSSIDYQPGEKGFSVLKMVHFFPTFGARKTGLHFLLNKLTPEQIGDVKAVLADSGEGSGARWTASTLAVSTRDLSIERLEELLGRLTLDAAPEQNLTDGADPE